MEKPTIEEFRARLEQGFDIWGSGVRKHDKITNGNLIVIEEWLKNVKGGVFIDYDGHGEFAMQRADGPWLTTHLSVKPSDITKFGITPPKWATHVLWFNR